MSTTLTATAVTMVDGEWVEVSIDGRLFRSVDHHLITDRAKSKASASPVTAPSVIPEPPTRKRHISKTEANLLFGPIIHDTVSDNMFESFGVNIREHLRDDLLEYLSQHRRFSNIRSFMKDKLQSNDKYAYQITRAYLHYLDASAKIQELIQSDGEKSYTKIDKSKNP